MIAKGTTGTFEVDGDTLVVTRKGWNGRLQHGRTAPRTIDLHEVVGVLTGTAFMAGWTRFVLRGEHLPEGYTPKEGDPHVMFHGKDRKSLAEWVPLREHLEAAAARNPPNDPPPPAPDPAPVPAPAAAPAAAVPPVAPASSPPAPPPAAPEPTRAERAEAKAQRRQVKKDELLAKQARDQAASSDRLAAESAALHTRHLADGVRPDVAAAAARSGAAALGAGNEVTQLSEHLAPAETVLHAAPAQHADSSGLLVLTDRRLLWLRSTWRENRTAIIPLSAVTTVTQTGMMTAKLTVHTPTGDHLFEQMILEHARDIVLDITTR